MSKQGKNNYNPNTAVFIPGTFTSSSSSTSLHQGNMSSLSAPPAVNPKTRPKTKNSSSSSTRAQHKPQSRSNAGAQSRSAASSAGDYLDEYDFATHFEDEVIMNGAGAGGYSGSGARGARRGQISINHLLEFSLPSRDNDDNSGSSRASRARPQNKSRRRLSDKDRDKIHLKGREFVNANYRFVVDDRCDYNGHVLDPNLLLDKSQILRVIVPKGHHCPICLTEDIVAPRMISCGHLFCHTCLLSLLESESLEDEKARKKNQLRNAGHEAQFVYQHVQKKKLKECPLCSEYVKSEDTLPVLINDTDERFEIPKIGQDVVLKLMAKPHGSILPIPRSMDLNPEKIGNTPWYSNTEVYPYARIMKGGLKFIVDCYERDKAAIEKQFEEDRLLFNDEGKYVQWALQEIDMYLDVMKQSYGGNYNEAQGTDSLISSMNNVSLSGSELDDSNCYFFYETAFNSSTRYFLSPLDVKVLLRTYGTYSEFPTTLVLKVDNINYGYMVTEQTVKRLKYMTHLPFGTEFAFIDVNWKNELPPEIYKMFAKELGERRRRLLSKMQKEDHAKKTYETELDQKTREFYMQENQGWGSYEFLSSQERINMDHHVQDSSLHPLGDDEMRNLEPNENTDIPSAGDFTTTVWGTQIPKTQHPLDYRDLDEEDDPFNTEELLRFALESNKEVEGQGDGTATKQKKKKGRKKLIVLSSSGQTRDYK